MARYRNLVNTNLFTFSAQQYLAPGMQYDGWISQVRCFNTTSLHPHMKYNVPWYHPAHLTSDKAALQIRQPATYISTFLFYTVHVPLDWFSRHFIPNDCHILYQISTPWAKKYCGSIQILYTCIYVHVHEHSVCVCCTYIIWMYCGGDVRRLRSVTYTSVYSSMASCNWEGDVNGDV